MRISHQIHALLAFGMLLTSSSVFAVTVKEKLHQLALGDERVVRHLDRGDRVVIRYEILVASHNDFNQRTPINEDELISKLESDSEVETYYIKIQGTFFEDGTAVTPTDLYFWSEPHLFKSNRKNLENVELAHISRPLLSTGVVSLNQVLVQNIHAQVSKALIKELKERLKSRNYLMSKPVPLAVVKKILLNQNQLKFILNWQTSQGNHIESTKVETDLYGHVLSTSTVSEYNDLSEFSEKVVNTSDTRELSADGSWNYLQNYSNGSVGSGWWLKYRDQDLMKIYFNTILYLETYPELVTQFNELEKQAKKKGATIVVESFFQRLSTKLKVFGGAIDAAPATNLVINLKKGSEILCSFEVYPYNVKLYSKNEPPFRPLTVYRGLLKFAKKCNL